MFLFKSKKAFNKAVDARVKQKLDEAGYPIPAKKNEAPRQSGSPDSNVLPKKDEFKGVVI